MEEELEIVLLYPNVLPHLLILQEYLFSLRSLILKKESELYDLKGRLNSRSQFGS
jgi:hypothetical protein